MLSICLAIADSSIGMGLSQARHRVVTAGHIDVIGDIIEIARRLTDAMSASGPACVKTRRLRLAVEVGNDEAILCPDCLHQTTNAQNADYPFHIVGQDV